MGRSSTARFFAVWTEANVVSAYERIGSQTRLLERSGKRFPLLERNVMGLILLIVLIVLLLGSVPAWPYSTNWGYYPSSGLGLLLVVLVILMLMRVV